MKLIILILVIVAFYFFLINTTIEHVDCLPYEQRVELDAREGIRKALISNHVKGVPDKCPKEVSHMINERKKKQRNILELINFIKNKYINTDKTFNLQNLPVSHNKNNRKYSSLIDKNFSKLINDIKRIFGTDISIIKNKILFSKETDNEFIIYSINKIRYYDKKYSLLTKYYGKIESDMTTNFLPERHYSNKLELIDIDLNLNNKKNNIQMDTPFMSMNEQMEYVKKINEQHMAELEKN